MDELDDLSTLEVFRLEAEEHLRNLRRDALGPEGGAPDGAAMARMMRDLHTLKGAARLVGLAAVQRLTHALESVLETAARGQRALTPHEHEGVLEAVDLLGELLAREEAESPRLETLLLTLAGLAPARAAGPSEPQEPATPDALSTPMEAPGGSSARVSVERLDRMMGLAGELHIVHLRLLRVYRQLQAAGKPLGQLDSDWRQAAALGADGTELARSRLESLVRANARASGFLRKEFESDLDALDDTLGQLERLHQDLEEQVMQARMLPLDYLLDPFPRLVRDLALELGKQVSFRTEGAETRVDRDVLEGLRQALMHLLQNAVDHGVEPPEERLQAGKPARAEVVLSARYLGDRLVVEVKDDGRGVAIEEIRRQAVARGLVAAERAVRMAPAELLGLLFRRGFSTAPRLTGVSGRGVGLDVVKSAVDHLHGDIEVTSQEGAGTRFAIRLPLSVAVTRVLLAKAGSVLWAFAVDHLDRLLTTPHTHIKDGPGGKALALDGESVRLVMLADQLAPTGLTRTVAYDQNVVLLSDGGARVGVAVDRFIEEEDVIVKKLDARLGKVPCVMGAAVTRSGDVALVLDVPELVRRMDELSDGLVSEPAPAAASGRYRVLVVEDSRTTREVNRRLLSGAGYDVTTASDGLEALDKLATGAFDLVLSDLTMPGLDGLALTRRIKSDPRLADLPVVILSFKDRDEDLKRAELVGADAYLVKEQADHREILQTLARVLSRATPARRGLPGLPARPRERGRHD
ncbi:MAG: response regulator [Candidatus Wallbacteria bacterium]|nr:response regulator [Candidatus Wallbacteria bacterium]